MTGTEHEPTPPTGLSFQLKKWVLPLVIIFAGIVVMVLMIRLKPEVEKQVATTPAPMVRVMDVAPVTHHFKVRSQGTVNPRTESQLVPEVSGRIVSVSPAFNAGGFFGKGDVLLTIDPYDYSQAVVRAEADVARAELALAREEAEAEVARREWEELGRDEEPTPLTLREPQMQDARATLAASRSALHKAGRDLDRTEIRAPYAGRVRAKTVDVGQFVSRGAPLASIYAVDFAEIRLPLPDDDLAFIDLPVAYRGGPGATRGATVTLSADFAGERHTWEGSLVRTEGEIDPRSRLVYAIARVADPYGRGTNPDRPPLAAGMFVEAEIHGREVEDVFRIPREALRGADQVLVVDENNRIRFRTLSILRTTRDDVIATAGLAAGEKICISPLQAVTEGMEVRIHTGGEAGA
ncbi:MAG: efflux RND transporter periplasmic adaptor subunit [Acidobacteria bacterium]|uniref:Efflux RND transporter periplasmic adaptor subunit n=1 Tax=Candidatus Polarisedimenticola svalbardensis TaxID=2886004 RepID=A0A8J6Y685_9BACT|nr:efflux RND transporter periplasmic adaptor subunit [Candidatus Polarisedimenticola svalbardensis]